MTTRNLSVALPPEMLSRIEQLAHKQQRTMNELVSEALLQYERSLWWDEMNKRPDAIPPARQK